MSQKSKELWNDLGLLALRLGAGGLMLDHGWSKLSRYGELLTRFSDPLGVGSAASLSLAVFAEFFCSIALILGLLTRAVAVPLLITMAVAALVVHAEDPWSRKEHALLFLVPYLTLLLTGGGRFSLDSRVLKGRLAFLR